MTQSYVLLDRDGVINIDSDEYIKSPEEWEPIPQSLEAIALLNQQGYKVVVITNQSGIGRGFYDESTLAQIHHKMNRMAKNKGGEIEAVYYCPHLPDDHCLCRKPKAGLLRQFEQDSNRVLTDLFFVGDKLADIQTAQAVGAKPILVRTGKGEQTLINNPDISSPIFKNLYDAAKFITS
jgi:D-glycero-D-manno-heptose 1,7-bisphosphate phosphatase